MKAELFLVFIIVTLALRGFTAAGELKASEITARSGQFIEIPVIIDQVDNLAGVKLVMKYNKEILAYKASMKTKDTESFMHIVNDKKPGVLILVMASANGIKGERIPIMKLIFEVKKDITEKASTQISIMESQLVGDDLKERKSNITTDPITIRP